MENLRDLASELDYIIGSIGVTVSTLADVDVLFGQLVESMNEAVYRGGKMTCYNEHHRKIRVYRELIRYSLNELSKEYEKADNISARIFNAVIKNETKEI